MTDWGDYGDILQHGMSARVDGRLALERTGPYIPPITFPFGSVLLASAARLLLEGSTLTGFTFLPVEKVLTVELNWQDWDLSAAEPLFYPDSGEPEDYVLGQPNSESARAALGDVWEIIVSNTATVLRPKPIVDSYKELRLDLETWNGQDLIRSTGYGAILFSERARDWFKNSSLGSYVEFDEFPTT